MPRDFYRNRCALGSIPQYSSTPTKGWLAGWSYRKKIIVTGQTGASTDYQIKLLIGETSGATGEDFDLGGHSSDFPAAKNDGGDIRFTSDDGTTELPFWVESVSGTTPNRLTTVWVKVSADLGTNQDIYCYYGNASTTSASNGDNTFIFFDDFEGSSLDTNKWTQTDVGASGTRSTTVSSSILSVSCRSNSSSVAERYIQSNTSFDINGSELVSYFRFPNWGLGSAGYYRNSNVVINTRDSNYGLSCGGDENGFKLNHNSSSDTTWTSSSNLSGSDNPTGYAIRKFSAKTNVKFLSNGTQLYSSASDIPNTSEKIRLNTANWSSSYSAGAIYMDYIFLKKFIDTEPAFSSAGSEET